MDMSFFVETSDENFFLLLKIRISEKNGKKSIKHENNTTSHPCI
jgi:hypothetical protein